MFGKLQRRCRRASEAPCCICERSPFGLGRRDRIRVCERLAVRPPPCATPGPPDGGLYDFSITYEVGATRNSKLSGTSEASLFEKTVSEDVIGGVCSETQRDRRGLSVVVVWVPPLPLFSLLRT